MDPVVIGLLAFGGLAVATRSYAEYQRRKQESVKELRGAWGRPRHGAPTAAEASLYHDLRLAADDTWAVDDRTWQDLFLPQIFSKLNHTRSRVGSQMLYRLLRTPSFNIEEIARRDRVIRLFSDKAALREAFQQTMEPLSSEDAALLPNLFLSEMPPRPTGYWCYPVLTVTMLMSIGAALLNHSLALGLLPLMIINIVVSKAYRDKVDQWIQPIRVLNTLVRAGRKCAALAAADGSECLQPIVKPIADNQPTLSSLDRTTRWLLFERNNSSDPLMIVVEYINMILLLDVNAFVFSMEAIRKYKDTIRDLFEAVGVLDALLSVASYRQSVPHWCTPAYTDSPRHIAMMDGLHPLIPTGVGNSLTIEGKGILITGSNMSGKTTFIRTIGINALMGQSIATCTASSFTSPLLGVETSIGRSDSLSEGKSFYLDEVEAIGDFLTDAQDSGPCLFIIDEIFRGTNTTERVAASKAVLDSLNRADGAHIVLVSTHDVELPNLLETPWDRYHFREYVEDGDLRFDYHLRPGLSSTRNALRLLAAKGYPAEVVADAEATALVIEAGLNARRKQLEIEHATSQNILEINSQETDR